MSGRGLRIAYLSGSPRIATRDDAEVSGPRAHILGLIEALRGDGHVVEEYILGDELRADVSGEGSGRLVHGGWLRQLAVDVVRLLLRVVVGFRARRRLQGAFDVTYERYALFQQLGRRFQRAGSFWVVETNAVMSQEARRERNALALQRLAGALERRTYLRADLVVCISEPLRDLLVTEAAVDAGKILVVPNGVDLRRFPAPETRAGDVGEGELVVGFVGFVIERQGLDELIAAVAALRARGRRVRAVIVGDGPDRERLERQVADRGLQEAVAFPGQVAWTDVPGWIASFSVGYSGQRGVAGMPMYHSPLKIYEYLAMARPVIATHHRDAEEALLRPGVGWTFPAGDGAALVDVMDAVAALGADELSAAGERARRHVEEHHTWTHRARQVLDDLERRGLRA
jgi:glycosyltransferase involved in cell wall biosynthesis